MPSSKHRAGPSTDTLPIEDTDSRRPGVDSRLALTVVWSVHEPGRAGEIAFLPDDPARSWILGRASDSSPDAPHVAFARRPGSGLEGSPLRDPHISRRQLRLTPRDGGALQVENIGRAPLRLRGATTVAGVAQPGDLLEIDSRLLLLVTRRAPDDASESMHRFPFGEADADGIVGESDAAWGLRRRIRGAATSPGHVLVLGASGSGKELVARAVHAHSSRGARPIVARNASTFPETLVDAELFGNARSFPNQGMPERPGLVGAAHGSSLFLDEIGDLPIQAQSHFLRVLDRGEYQRLGESQSRVSDLRVIGATNRPRSALRPDLSARFVHEIAVPSFDARREDIPLLARFLLRRFARDGGARAQEILVDGPEGPEPRISTRFMQALFRADLETNVRQLEAILWRALDDGTGPVLDPVRLHDGALWPGPRAAPSPDRGGAELTEAERLKECLDRNNGSIEKSWRELGLSSRHALRRLIAKHGVVLRRQSSRPRD